MTEKTNFKKKSLARLMACQSLCMYFDENNSDKDISSILNIINENYIKVEVGNAEDYAEIYKDKFVLDMVEGVLKNYKEYDTLINKLLNKQNTTETLDEIFLNSFRLACQELKFSDIDKNLIINEYTDIVAKFYDGIYVNFANGITENLAKYIRDGESIENIKNNNYNEKKSIDSNEKNTQDIKMGKANKIINKKDRKIITLKK